jgi:hypothetical protein
MAAGAISGQTGASASTHKSTAPLSTYTLCVCKIMAGKKNAHSENALSICREGKKELGSVDTYRYGIGPPGPLFRTRERVNKS